MFQSAQLCDGVIDCADVSDECLCESTEAMKLCDQLRPGQMLLCDNSSTLISISSICDGKIDCNDLFDEQFCRHATGKNLLR